MNTDIFKKTMKISYLITYLGLLTYSVFLSADDKMPLSANKQLTTIITERWDYSLRENPMSATHAGVEKYNHLLNRVSSVDNNRRLDAEKVFFNRLTSINVSALTAENRINHQLLKWVLEQEIEGYQLNLSRIPLTTFSSFFMSVLNMANGLPMTSVKDYQDYISRLNDIPRYFNENIDNMRTGIKTNFTLPKIVVEGIFPTVMAQVYKDPTKSSLYKPFIKISGDISAENQIKKAIAKVCFKQALAKVP